MVAAGKAERGKTGDDDSGKYETIGAGLIGAAHLLDSEDDPRQRRVEGGGNAGRRARKNEARACTVGPSRPMEAPQKRPNTVRRILPKAIRKDNKRPSILFVREMPPGVMRSGMRKFHSPAVVMRVKPCWTRSASLAKPTLITPMASAPHQKTRRGRQRENEPQKTEDAGPTQQLGLAIECGHRVASIKCGGLSDGGRTKVIVCFASLPTPLVYEPILYFTRMAERESR